MADALARTAEIAGPDEALLAAMARDARARVIRDGGPGLRLDFGLALAEEPLALRRRVVQWALAQVSERSPSFAHVDLTLRFLERARPGVLALPDGRLELSAGQGVLSSRGRRRTGQLRLLAAGYTTFAFQGNWRFPRQGFCFGHSGRPGPDDRARAGSN